MKRLFLILLICIASPSFAQDIITTMEGKRIEVSIKEISDNSIVYKLWNNLEGPDFRMDKEAVAKIELQNGETRYFSELLKAIQSGIEVPTALKQNGFELLDAQTGTTLSQDKLALFLSKDQLDSYQSAIKFKSISNTLSIAGAAATGVGIGCFIAILVGIKNASYYDTEKYTLLAYPTGLLIGGGVSCLIASIPLRSVGKRKMESIAEDYNSQRPYFSVGATNYGFGLALNF